MTRQEFRMRRATEREENSETTTREIVKTAIIVTALVAFVLLLPGCGEALP